MDGVDWPEEGCDVAKAVPSPQAPLEAAPGRQPRPGWVRGRVRIRVRVRLGLGSGSGSGEGVGLGKKVGGRGRVRDMAAPTAWPMRP